MKPARSQDRISWGHHPFETSADEHQARDSTGVGEQLSQESNRAISNSQDFSP
jgi:hypothetical protein